MKPDSAETAQLLAEQQKVIQQQQLEIEYLKERIELLLSQVYGKKSEKRPLELQDQLSYLDDQPEEPDTIPIEEAVSVPAHTRKKSGRKPLPEELPRIEVIHDIPEDQKQCACGALLDWIGEEISEQLDFIPAQLRVIRHIRPKYACKQCEGVETEGKTVKIAPPPRQILEKSIVSAGLLAQIIVAKFVDALPFYRQEKQFARLGYELSRTNMANWTLQLGEIIQTLLKLLKQEVLSGPLIHMDETTIQVLKEKGRSPSSKSYMWVMRTGASAKPAVYFHYSTSRASAIAQELLKSYQGVIQTDGYAGYDFIDSSSELIHAGCWAHARRKFMEVLKVKGKYHQQKLKTGHASQAVEYIRQLYALEDQADEKQFSFEQRLTLREEKAKPLLNEFHQWLKNLDPQVPPKGLLGKAIAYTLSRWDQLTRYLDHGFVGLDNNAAENAIRPFVVGRKNFLFCDTPAGAEAMAGLYSLVETARANQLNPYEYLKRLFEQPPYAETEDQMGSLLPQYLNPTRLDSE